MTPLANQAKPEQKIATVRQSLFNFFLWSLIPIFLVGLAFFFIFPLFNAGAWGIFIFCLALGFGLLWLVRNFYVWLKQSLTITSVRLIDYDQQGIFQKIVSEINLRDVNDIFFQTKGLIQTVTRTGNLYLKAENNRTKIEIKNIAQPQKIQRLILQLKSELAQENPNYAEFSGEKLINLVKKIKTDIGAEKFSQILAQLGQNQIEKK